MEAKEKLRKLRESTGMNRKEFCEYFEIPYMTETDWELGNRRVPQYPESSNISFAFDGV